MKLPPTELFGAAELWLAQANKCLASHGAPSLGTLKDHQTYEEATPKGEFIAMNVMNAFVLSFTITFPSQEIEVGLSVNHGEDGASRHKIAVLTNVLTTVELQGFGRVTIGLPFVISEGELRTLEEFD